METALTQSFVVASCRKNGQFSTPSLNDVLYLHYKSFTCIANDALDAYTGLRTLWLEGNALQCIEGLNSLSSLRSLYMQVRFLEKRRISVAQRIHCCVVSVITRSIAASDSFMPLPPYS